MPCDADYGKAVGTLGDDYVPVIMMRGLVLDHDTGIGVLDGLEPQALILERSGGEARH